MAVEHRLHLAGGMCVEKPTRQDVTPLAAEESASASLRPRRARRATAPLFVFAPAAKVAPAAKAPVKTPASLPRLEVQPEGTGVGPAPTPRTARKPALIVEDAGCEPARGIARKPRKPARPAVAKPAALAALVAATKPAAVGKPAVAAVAAKPAAPVAAKPAAPVAAKLAKPASAPTKVVPPVVAKPVASSRPAARGKLARGSMSPPATSKPLPSLSNARARRRTGESSLASLKPRGKSAVLSSPIVSAKASAAASAAKFIASFAGPQTVRPTVPRPPAMLLEDELDSEMEELGGPVDMDDFMAAREPVAAPPAAEAPRPAAVAAPRPAAVAAPRPAAVAVPSPPAVVVAAPVAAAATAGAVEALFDLPIEEDFAPAPPPPPSSLQLSAAERAFFAAGDQLESSDVQEDTFDDLPATPRSGFWSRITGKQASAS
jgi:hypothetical protein